MQKDSFLLRILFCILMVFISIHILHSNLWGYANIDYFIRNVFVSTGASLTTWIHTNFHYRAVDLILGNELIFTLINSFVVILFTSTLIVSSSIILFQLQSVKKRISFKTYASLISLIVFLFSTYEVISMSSLIYDMYDIFIEFGVGVPFMTWIRFFNLPISMFWAFVMLYIMLNLLRYVCSYYLAIYMQKRV